MPDKEVTVAITPNGLADGLTTAECEMHGKEQCFVMPEEVTMRMESFLDTLLHPKYSLLNI